MLLKNKTYTIGLTLIIISFIACTLSFYLIVFGIPLFIIGTITVLLSKINLKTKLITTILPIILWFPATFIFLYFYGLTTPETYLIPNNFEGKFRVVYGERCGIEPKREKGRRILQIPLNGLLIIKSKFESGRIDHEYFLVDQSGRKTKVNQELYFKDKKREYPSVSLAGTGSMGGPMPDGSSSTESVEAIHFSDFWVYNKDSTITEDYKASMRFDSLTSMKVENCRQHLK